MAMNFCPLCKSVMKEGICTNRNCGNSQLEIDFNKFTSRLKGLNPEKLNIINNSFLEGLEMFEEALTYDRSKMQRINGGVNSLSALKPFIQFNLNTNVKYANFMANEDKTGILNDINIFQLRYFSIKQAKPRPIKIYKHYVEFRMTTTMRGFKRTQNKKNAIVFGSNDLEKWFPAGWNSLQGNEVDVSEKVEALVELVYAQTMLWTLKIIDNKTGVAIKTFFTKDKAYQFFKDREIKCGKKKRTALKHIVNSYEREKPKKVLVKEHLRGDMVFEWRGITFELHPSLIDKMRIEEARRK